MATRKSPTKTAPAKKAAGSKPAAGVKKAAAPGVEAPSARRRAVPAPAPAAAQPPPPAASGTGLSPEERYRAIAHAAYLRAERRGFAPGHEVDDWLAAEAEFEASVTADQG
jgi:hypothetical protein